VQQNKSSLPMKHEIGCRGIVIAACTVLKFRGISRDLHGLFDGHFHSRRATKKKMAHPAKPDSIGPGEPIMHPAEISLFATCNKVMLHQKSPALVSNLLCFPGMTVFRLDKNTTRLLAI
jgi:hypothetical protein